MKQKIKQFLRGPLERVLQNECSLAVWWVSAAHKRLKWIQWRILPQPEHFDHYIDLFYQWRASRNSQWVERGVFGGLALKSDGQVLELACGDGFNARNFYSLRSKSVTACDFDPSAIRTAKQKNPAPNITYLLADIRTAMPQGSFDTVVWDAAIEHFTPDEIKKVLNDIKHRLKTGGTLTGYTIVEKKNGTKSLEHHEYEFKNKEDLARFLTPHFKNVTVFETLYPDRHNLYFWASDGDLPLTSAWPHSLHFSHEEKH